MSIGDNASKEKQYVTVPGETTVIEKGEVIYVFGWVIALREGDELGNEQATLVDIKPRLAHQNVERSALLNGAVGRTVDVVLGDDRPVLARH